MEETDSHLSYDDRKSEHSLRRSIASTEESASVIGSIVSSVASGLAANTLLQPNVCLICYIKLICYYMHCLICFLSSKYIYSVFLMY